MKISLNLPTLIVGLLCNSAFAQTTSGSFTHSDIISRTIQIDFSALKDNSDIQSHSLPILQKFDLEIKGTSVVSSSPSLYTIQELEPMVVMNLSLKEMIIRKMVRLKPASLNRFDLIKDHVAYKISTSEGGSAFLIRNGTYIGGYNRYYSTWVYESNSTSANLSQSKVNKRNTLSGATPSYSVKGERMRTVSTKGANYLLTK